MVKNTGEKPFFDTLWEAAVKLRGALEPAEYKHPVLGLIFLKYVGDTFDEFQVQLNEWMDDPENDDYYSDDPEFRKETLNDRTEYVSRNIIWFQRPLAGKISANKRSKWISMSESTRPWTLSKKRTRN